MESWEDWEGMMKENYPLANERITEEEIRKYLTENTNKLFRDLNADVPNLHALCSPKDYARPLGYPDPRLYMLSAYTGATTLFKHRDPMEDMTSYTVYVTAACLIRYQVPTYFVSEDLCEALLRTDAPEDMIFSEIKMPMPAMLFMLPTEFSKRYFGHEVPYLTAHIVPPYSEITCPLRVRGQPLPPLNVMNDKAFMAFTCLCMENGFPMHYDSRCPVDRPVADLMGDVPFATYRVTELQKDANIEEDQKTCKRMTNLAVNILLGMTNVPNLITREKMIRPAKKAYGHLILRRALWKPNFIGEKFKITYDPHVPEGTHRSPAAHWRRGHWRNQRYGEKLAFIKRLWIEPVFVGLKKD